MEANSALELARKQKRLKYWKERFEQGNYNRDTRQSVEDLLKTYCLAISKLAKAKEDEDVSQAKDLVERLERKLFDYFKLSTLQTSHIYNGKAR